MSALQTNINTLMSANSVDELKSRLVAILTTIAETPAGSGITAVTSNDGSIDIDNTDPDAPDLSIPSGAFTPTISNETDCTAECLRALYSRSGNVVTVSYYLSIGLDPLITSGGFNVSLPIPSSFVSPRDAFGVISPITDPFSLLVAPIINADTVENEISMTIELSTPAAALTFVANIQYIIL